MPRRSRIAFVSRYTAVLAAAGAGLGVLTGMGAAGDIRDSILNGRIASLPYGPAPVQADAAPDSVIRPATASVSPADAPLAEAMGYSMAAQLRVKDEAACARLDEVYRAGCRQYLDAEPPPEDLPVASVL